MNKTRQIVMATLLLMGFVLTGSKGKAQTNAQLFYDFGSDRKFVTLTLEMFKADKWGNTYFFVDHDFNYDDHVEGSNLAPGGSYLEIARCINLWQESALKNFSLQVEYNGGITRSYPINNAWLFGVDYFARQDLSQHAQPESPLQNHTQEKQQHTHAADGGVDL